MGTGDTGNFEKSLMKKDNSASKIMATAQANSSEIVENSSNADIVLKGTSNSHPSQEAFSSKKSASKCSSGTGTGGYNDYDQEILKSKILLQWTCHYLWYGILLVGLHYTRWIYLFFWSLPTYAFISFVNLQLSRLLYKHNPSSVVPLYLSYVPFVTFFILSRQVHMVFSLLWFISVMAINLQLGSAKSKLHIVLAVAVFMVLYLLLAGGIKFMRSDPSRSDASGKTYVLARNNLTAVGCTEDSGNSNSLYAIRDNPERCAFEIKFLEELIFCFGGILVGIATFTLQDFIQKYAKSLLDRRNKVKNLKKINADLKSKLEE